MAQRRLSLAARRQIGRRWFLVACFVSVICLVGVVAWHAFAAPNVQVVEAHGADVDRGGEAVTGEVADDNDGAEAAGEVDSEDASASAAADGEAPVAQDVIPTIYVHVDGCVAHPNLYALTKADARVFDAISAAGGLLPEADTTQLNLAAPLADGDKIYVLKEGEAPATGAAVSSNVSGVSSAGSSGQSPASQLININTATAAELTELPGVGEATASSIVKDRETYGPFSSPEDLMRVSGIGQKKFDKLKDAICT